MEFMMKKIISLPVLLFLFTLSLFATDFSSSLKINGTLFGYNREDESVGLFSVKNENSLDFIALNFGITSDNAGGSFILPELSKIKDNNTEWNVWFKPIDILKIEAGTISNSLYKETTDNEEFSLIKYNDFGYSVSFAFNKFNISVALTPGNDQYWFYVDKSRKTKAGDEAYRKAYDDAYEYMYNYYYIKAYSENQGGSSTYPFSTGPQELIIEPSQGSSSYVVSPHSHSHTATINISEIIKQIDEKDSTAREKAHSQARSYAQKEAKGAKEKAIAETSITAFSGMNVFMSLKTSIGTFCGIFNAESNFYDFSFGAGYRKQFGPVALFADAAYYIVNRNPVKYSLDFDVIYNMDNINAQAYAIYSSGNEIGAIGKLTYRMGTTKLYLYAKDMDILNKNLAFTLKPGLIGSFGMLDFDLALDFYYEKDKFNILIPLIVTLQF